MISLKSFWVLNGSPGLGNPGAYSCEILVIISGSSTPVRKVARLGKNS